MKDFLSFASTHPLIVFNVLVKRPLTNKQRKQITLELINKLESKCDFGKNNLKQYYDEFQKNRGLITHIINSLKELENTGAFNPTFQTVIYALVRHLMPENIVETGVANGVSSTIILTAINLNKKGILHSIDLPTKFWDKTDYRKEDKVQVKNDQVGWIVPKELRNNWSLTLGKSKEKLPEVVKEIKKLDMFFHDSEHSYENMMFEFTTVWPYIVKKGIIIADDVNRNNAFDEFVDSHKNEVTSLKIGQFGFILKK
jgi:predicted O-methyltransferase YrrM